MNVYKVTSQYGKVHIDDDIWFNKPRCIAFVRYKWEKDAAVALKRLQRDADKQFELPEGGVKEVSQAVPKRKGPGPERKGLGPEYRAPGPKQSPGLLPRPSGNAAAGPAHTHHCKPAAGPAANLDTSQQGGLPSHAGGQLSDHAQPGSNQLLQQSQAASCQVPVLMQCAGSHIPDHAQSAPHQLPALLQAASCQLPVQSQPASHQLLPNSAANQAALQLPLVSAQTPAQSPHTPEQLTEQPSHHAPHCIQAQSQPSAVQDCPAQAQGSPAVTMSQAQGSPAVTMAQAQGSPAVTLAQAQGSPSQAPAQAQGSPSQSPDQSQPICGQASPLYRFTDAAHESGQPLQAPARTSVNACTAPEGVPLLPPLQAPAQTSVHTGTASEPGVPPPPPPSPTATATAAASEEASFDMACEASSDIMSIDGSPSMSVMSMDTDALGGGDDDDDDNDHDVSHIHTVLQHQAQPKASSDIAMHCMGGQLGGLRDPTGTAPHGRQSKPLQRKVHTPAQIAKKMKRRRKRAANKQNVAERRQRAALLAFAGVPSKEYSLDPPWVKKRKAKAEKQVKASWCGDGAAFRAVPSKKAKRAPRLLPTTASTALAMPQLHAAPTSHDLGHATTLCHQNLPLPITLATPTSPAKRPAARILPQPITLPPPQASIGRFQQQVVPQTPTPTEARGLLPQPITLAPPAQSLVQSGLPHAAAMHTHPGAPLYPPVPPQLAAAAATASFHPPMAALHPAVRPLPLTAAHLPFPAAPLPFPAAPQHETAALHTAAPQHEAALFTFTAARLPSPAAPRPEVAAQHTAARPLPAVLQHQGGHHAGLSQPPADQAVAAPPMHPTAASFHMPAHHTPTAHLPDQAVGRFTSASALSRHVGAVLQQLGAVADPIAPPGSNAHPTPMHFDAVTSHAAAASNPAWTASRALPQAGSDHAWRLAPPAGGSNPSLPAEPTPSHPGARSMQEPAAVYSCSSPTPVHAALPSSHPQASFDLVGPGPTNEALLQTPSAPPLTDALPQLSNASLAPVAAAPACSNPKGLSPLHASGTPPDHVSPSQGVQAAPALSPPFQRQGPQQHPHSFADRPWSPDPRSRSAVAWSPAPRHIRSPPYHHRSPPHYPKSPPYYPRSAPYHPRSPPYHHRSPRRDFRSPPYQPPSPRRCLRSPPYRPLSPQHRPRSPPHYPLSPPRGHPGSPPWCPISPSRRPRSPTYSSLSPRRRLRPPPYWSPAPRWAPASPRARRHVI